MAISENIVLSAQNKASKAFKELQGDAKRATTDIQQGGKAVAKGMDEAGNEIFYPFAGVEEVIPLARIFDRLKRPFIAPISPSGEGVRQYVLPSDPDHLKRHTVKMASKNDRQLGMLISEGFNFSWLKGAVMPEYRRF